MQKQTQILLPVVLVVVAALAFAGWRSWDVAERTASKWPDLDGGVYAEAVTSGGTKYLVPPNEVYDSGLSAEDRPSLTDPKYTDITTADNKLADGLEGIAVSVMGQERFYPFQILNWHPVVQDTISDVPLAITYSTLTGSAVVYSAVSDEAAGNKLRNFEDSGKVYNNAMLMIDTHGTLWNQTSGQAIVGETVGDRLTIYPSTVMSWATWKDLHPDGLALSTDTGFARDYGRHPYASYETSPGIFFPLNHVDSRLPPKDLVYRVDPLDPNNDQPIIFLGSYLADQADINEVVGNVLGNGDAATSIVVFYDAESELVRVFDRKTAEGVLTFEKSGNGYVDQETGSKWSLNGLATSGVLKGTQLNSLPVTRHYAFAQFAMFPNTIVSGEELLPTDAAQPEGEPLELN